MDIEEVTMDYEYIEDLALYISKAEESLEEIKDTIRSGAKKYLSNLADDIAVKHNCTIISEFDTILAFSLSSGCQIGYMEEDVWYARKSKDHEWVSIEKTDQEICGWTNVDRKTMHTELGKELVEELNEYIPDIMKHYQNTIYSDGSPNIGDDFHSSPIEYLGR